MMLRSGTHTNKRDCESECSSKPVANSTCKVAGRTAFDKYLKDKDIFFSQARHWSILHSRSLNGHWIQSLLQWYLWVSCEELTRSKKIWLGHCPIEAGREIKCSAGQDACQVFALCQYLLFCILFRFVGISYFHSLTYCCHARCKKVSVA